MNNKTSQRIITATDLGKIVRSRRKERGLTQAELAALCNTGIRFISGLENGKPTMQIEMILETVSMLALNEMIEER